jgi:hypothetical protein
LFRGLEKFLEVAGVPALLACLQCWMEGWKVGRSKVIYPGHSTLLPATHWLHAAAAQLNKRNEADPPRTCAHRPRSTLELKTRVTAPPADRLLQPGQVPHDLPPDLYNDAMAIGGSSDQLAASLVLRLACGPPGMYFYS